MRTQLLIMLAGCPDGATQGALELHFPQPGLNAHLADAQSAGLVWCQTQVVVRGWTSDLLVTRWRITETGKQVLK
jgi:hypothetical protein